MTVTIIKKNDNQNTVPKSTHIEKGRGYLRTKPIPHPRRESPKFIETQREVPFESVKQIDNVDTVLYNATYYNNTVKCKVCLDTRKVLVFDECPTCYGESSTCRTCHGKGEVKNYIKCPECKGKKW